MAAGVEQGSERVRQAVQGGGSGLIIVHKMSEDCAYLEWVREVDDGTAVVAGCEVLATVSP